MINNQMKNYNYYTYSNDNAYGQPSLSETAQGKIKMAIYISSQSIQDNILFEDCAYIGLTTDAGVNSTYVIKYGEERLKVLYVNPQGHYKQVYMSRM